MFNNNNLHVEAVPFRVYELCKLAKKGTISISEIKENMFDNNSDYFAPCRDAALELGIISVNSDLNVIDYALDFDCTKSLDQFRRYCNSIIWKNKNSLFYKLTKAFCDSNLDWLKYNSISSNPVLLGEITEIIGNDNDISRHILALRFWLSFLGFGYIYERNKHLNFLPNAYDAIKDFISISKLESNKRMTMNDFFTNIYSCASVCVDLNDHNINFAVSSALRQMHEEKEILLERISDSKEVWNLFRLESNAINEITHITIKGVK